MKNLKKRMLAIALCVALAAMLALAGCSQSSNSSEESTSADDSATTVSDTAAKLDPNTDYTKPFFCMIMGGDTRDGTVAESEWNDSNSHSDVMILAYVNPSKKYISLLSIPRDTDVTYNGKEMKINTIMYEDGPEATCKFLEDKLGISIPYYFEMNFVQWAGFVDNMNGVDVDVPVALSWKDVISGENVKLSTGKQTLNGKEALVFARDRHQYSGAGEAVRQINNRNMVKSLITKVAKSSNPTSYADTLINGCQTNMNSAELKEYMANFLTKDGKISWNLGTAPWEGDFFTPDYWAVNADWDTVKSEIKAMKNGTDLTSIVALTDVKAGSN